MLPCAIVLAGGKSSRFGSDKARALVGDVTLLELCVSGLLGVFRQVLVVAKNAEGIELRQEAERVRLICDNAPEYAAMFGLYQGLRQSDRMLNYVVGCDMPLVLPGLIELLYKSVRGRECAVRCDVSGCPQPLGAFYSRKCIPLIQQMLEDRNYRLCDLILHSDAALVPFDVVALVDPGGHSFCNVNTPDDLERVRAALALSHGCGVDNQG